MIKNPRNLLWFIPLVLFATSPFWKPGVSAFLQPRGVYDIGSPDAPTDESGQSFLMDSITITMSSLGRVEWVVKAEKAFTVKSDKELGMIGVDAVYTGDEKEETRITSERGLYDVDKGHLVLIDKVMVDKPVSKQTMLTDLLHYYNSDKMIVSPGKVKLEGPDFSIEAGRLDYDLISKNYDFSNRVVCRF